MPLRIVQSKQNSRLKLLRQSLARPERAGELIGLEGANLLTEALRARLRIITVFVADGSEAMIYDFIRDHELPPETETLVVPRSLLDAALTTESPQPIAALVEPPRWTLDDLLGRTDSLAPTGSKADSRRDAPSTPGETHDEGPILILAGLQDPGNLGTILRSAEAFGAAGILSLPGTVSPWNAKALRASAGSAFRLPFVTVEADEAFGWLHKQGRRIWTTDVHGAQPLTTSDLTGPIALIIGNEGNGVAAEIAAYADASITIPCPGLVESLNAAVAASILLYEVSRQLEQSPYRRADHSGSEGIRQ